MQIETISARRAVDNAFLQESISKTEFETFRQRLLKLLNQADEAVRDGESEEHLKGLIRPFLNHTNFEEKYYINTKKAIQVINDHSFPDRQPLGLLVLPIEKANYVLVSTYATKVATPATDKEREWQFRQLPEHLQPDATTEGL